MNLEKQVCSLPLAKQLKELGVKQDARYYWHEWDDGSAGLSKMKTECIDDHYSNSFSAFTVAELGEMLPNCFKSEEHGYVNLVMMKLYDGHSEVMYKSGKEVAYVERAGTEADARAKMLIYLLENKLTPLQS